MSMTASPEACIERIIQRVLTIRYLIQFQGNKINALIDSGREVNAMTSVCVAQIGFAIRLTKVNAQKIDGFPLKTYEIAFAKFLVKDEKERDRFFEVTFLLINTSMKVILRCFFFCYVILTSILR